MIDELKRKCRELEKFEREILLNAANASNPVYRNERTSFARGVHYGITVIRALLTEIGEDEL